MGKIYVKKGEFLEKAKSKIQFMLNESMQSVITLEFSQNSNEVITSSSIDEFMSIFLNEANQKKLTPVISLINTSFLDKESTSVLINNGDFLKKLDKSSFLNLAISSYEANEQVLSNKQAETILENSYEVSNEQTFTKSCTAKAILMSLYELNVIDKSGLTRANELRIYREIWSNPGATASPEKIIEYIDKKKYENLTSCKSVKLHISGIEIQRITQEFLEIAADMTLSENYKYQGESIINSYSIFKNATKKDIKVFNSMIEVDLDKKFSKGNALLIEGRKSGMHTIFAKKNKDGKVVVNDPAYGEIGNYNSMADYCYREENKFLGVGFLIYN